MGPDVDLMLDAWMSWDLPYAVQVGRIAEFAPRWLEEPTLPDSWTSTPRSGGPCSRWVSPSPGEHEYTRWGLKLYLDGGCVDVVQPDIYWCGGSPRR